MTLRRAVLGALCGWVAAAVVATSAAAHGSGGPAERLPVIGDAALFTLTDRDGAAFSMTELRGKVIAVSFIYTRCADVCPLLVDRMAGVAADLGEDFGPRVNFITITLDPEHDDPATLRRYAREMGADRPGWHFLTGRPSTIRTLAGQYGVFATDTAGGDVTHTLLTSIIDRDGRLRVQYMGERFDPAEFLHDLRTLIAEDGGI